MHFFNPPPLMKLLEVIAGLEFRRFACHRPCRRRGDGQARHRRCRRPRVPRQPLQPPVRPRGAEAARRARRRPRDDRPHLPPRGRIQDGPLRAVGPRRRRRRLRDREVVYQPASASLAGGRTRSWRSSSPLAITGARAVAAGTPTTTARTVRTTPSYRSRAAATGDSS